MTASLTQMTAKSVFPPFGQTSLFSPSVKIANIAAAHQFPARYHKLGEAGVCFEVLFERFQSGILANEIQHLGKFLCYLLHTHFCRFGTHMLERVPDLIVVDSHLDASLRVMTSYCFFFSDSRRRAGRLGPW